MLYWLISLTILVSGAPAMPSTSAPQAGTALSSIARASANKAFIQAAFDRWTAGGGAFFDEVLAPDMVWTITGSGEGTGTYRGRERFKQQVIAPFAARLAKPLHLRVEAIWAEGDHVIVHWCGNTITRTGKPYRNEYVWILRMLRRRALEVTAFLDMNAYRSVLTDG